MWCLNRKPGRTGSEKATAWLGGGKEQKQDNIANSLVFLSFWSHHPQREVDAWFLLFLTRC